MPNLEYEPILNQDISHDIFLNRIRSAMGNDPERVAVISSSRIKIELCKDHFSESYFNTESCPKEGVCNIHLLSRAVEIKDWASEDIEIFIVYLGPGNGTGYLRLLETFSTTIQEIMHTYATRNKEVSFRILGDPVVLSGLDQYLS